MPIHKLPEYMINRLKAGEIVERPASVVKELIENSLDAQATFVKVSLNDGGKTLIGVEDNGCGIELTDMDLLLERYATSKIYGEQDLLNLKTYGFRGEALASIAEVSKITIISKTSYSEIGTKLVKMGESITMNHLPVGFEHGTIVLIQDLFYNVPARLKFLKSSQTEFFYCYNYFVDIALYHYNKSFALYKNDKIVFDLGKVDSLMERLTQIYKKDYSKNFRYVQFADNQIHLFGLVSDSSLTFGSSDNIKIYIDGRPVQDKIIKRALMDAYAKQINSGEYPFAVLLFTTQAGIVDVNVHPKKLEVRFVDSQKIYQIVFDAISKVLSENKIIHVDAKYTEQCLVNNEQSKNFQKSVGFREKKDFGSTLTSSEGREINQENIHQNAMIGEYKVVGQLWDSYIVLQGEDGIYYIDQHALAERIAFEKMKKDLTLENNLKPDILLQPLLLEIPKIPNIDDKIKEVNELGFDCSLFSENRIIVYAVPQIFVMYKVDLEKLFTHIFYLEHINFDHVLDQIFASKACKTSIKAGDKLSLIQMIELVKEGFDVIDGMFVCQHGRPFFVKSNKKDLDKFFDR